MKFGQLLFSPFWRPKKRSRSCSITFFLCIIYLLTLTLSHTRTLSHTHTLSLFLSLPHTYTHSKSGNAIWPPVFVCDCNAHNPIMQTMEHSNKREKGFSLPEILKSWHMIWLTIKQYFFKKYFFLQKVHILCYYSISYRDSKIHLTWVH